MIKDLARIAEALEKGVEAVADLAVAVRALRDERGGLLPAGWREKMVVHRPERGRVQRAPEEIDVSETDQAAARAAARRVGYLVSPKKARR